MRRLLSLLITLLIAIPFYADNVLTLEATLDGYVYPFSQKSVLLSGLGHEVYFPNISAFNAAECMVKGTAYNADYSVYAKIDTRLEIPESYQMQSAAIISSPWEKNHLAVLVNVTMVNSIWGDDNYCDLLLFDDKGNLLFDFGSTSGTFMPIQALFWMNGSYKFVVIESLANSEHKTRIYKVNNNILSDIKATQLSSTQAPIGLYNMEGKLVDSQFSSTSISKLPKGVYIYNTEKSSSKILVK